MCKGERRVGSGNNCKSSSYLELFDIDKYMYLLAAVFLSKVVRAKNIERREHTVYF